MGKIFASGGVMSINIIENKEIWDTFVNKSSDGMLFHKWDYLEAMSEFTGYTLERYGIYDGEELIALFPIFLKNSFGFKSLFSPPPQTGVPYLGFIMSQDYYSLKQSKKEAQLSIVSDDFDALVKKRNFNYVFIALIPNFLDIRHFKWKSYETNMSYTYSIDLSQSYNEIFNGFKNTVRRMLKKATTYNLVLEKSDDVSLFYSMETKRYEEQGFNFPIVSQKYLEKLFSLYPENLVLYSIYDNEKNVKSFVLTQEYNNKFLLLMGATRPQDSIGENEFIICELIKKAKEENYKYFDFVGANNQNLCMFKSKFNPSLDFTCTIKKQDFIGSLAEFVYIEVIKKK
jgi:hypothetical protein